VRTTRQFPEAARLRLKGVWSGQRLKFSPCYIEATLRVNLLSLINSTLAVYFMLSKHMYNLSGLIDSSRELISECAIR
jgi:hypothetical protein